MNQKTLNIVFGIVIFLLIVAAAYFALSKKSVQPGDNTFIQENDQIPSNTQNQNINEPAAAVNTNKTAENTNQPTVPTADWKSYSGNGFSAAYPPYLSQDAEKGEVKPPITSVVSFQGTAPQSNLSSLLLIEQMFNQGGLTLTDWTNEVASQSGWVKQGSIKISGQTAHILVLPETDAGARYFFLSKDGRTMYIMTIQHFDQTTVDSIISSFALEK